MFMYRPPDVLKAQFLDDFELFVEKLCSNHRLPYHCQGHISGVLCQMFQGNMKIQLKTTTDTMLLLTVTISFLNMLKTVIVENFLNSSVLKNQNI